MATIKRQHAKDDALTPDEIHSLFQACEDLHEKLLICAAGQLGMRVGEIAHLSKAWIDFQSDRISIPRSMTCECHECQKRSNEWRPKTKQGSRTIPFRHFPTTREVLKSYFAVYDKVNATRRTLQRRLKIIASRAGFTKTVYPHAARAGAAIMFADAGLSAQGLCEVMGWEDLRTAQAYISRSGRTAAREIEVGKESFVL